MVKAAPARKFGNDANYFGGKRKVPKAKSKFVSIPLSKQGTSRKKGSLKPLANSGPTKDQAGSSRMA